MVEARRHSPEVLAIVGMRSGSKGVPDKNVRPLAGRPLVAWILETARRATSVSRLVVSTDSQGYADIAKEHGAEVPCLRPEMLAQDASQDHEYIVHMLAHLAERELYKPDIILRLLPTVPFQQPADLDALVDLLMNEPDADSAVAVAPAQQHPLKAMRIVSESGQDWLRPYVNSLTQDLAPVARQGFAPAYFRANAIATRHETLERFGSLTGKRVLPLVVPEDRSIDIDTAFDFELATLLMKQRINGGRE